MVLIEIIIKKTKAISSPDGSKYPFWAWVQPKRYCVQREGSTYGKLSLCS